jgi:hydrogenase/urease accessory protein HupE
MRKYLTLFLLMAMAPVASAHTAPSEDGLVSQLVHQLLGLHHLPLTALILVAGILALRVWRKKSS